MLPALWNGGDGCVLYQLIHCLSLGPIMSFRVMLRDDDYQDETTNSNGHEFTISMRKKLRLDN